MTTPATWLRVFVERQMTQRPRLTLCVFFGSGGVLFLYLGSEPAWKYAAARQVSWLVFLAGTGVGMAATAAFRLARWLRTGRVYACRLTEVRRNQQSNQRWGWLAAPGALTAAYALYGGPFARAFLGGALGAFTVCLAVAYVRAATVFARIRHEADGR